MTNTSTDISFELCKANLQFSLRTNRLLKECGQRWLDAFNFTVGESIAETQKDIDNVSLSDNWQSQAFIPGETILRLMQTRVGNAQSIVQAVVTNQTLFLTGLHDAFLTWQQDAAKATGNLEAARSFNTVMDDFLKLFNNTATAEGQS
jgi:hypothetical protein